MTISWALVADANAGTVKFSTSGTVPIDVSLLNVDDYAVVKGVEFSTRNQGSWTITDVEYYYSSGVLIQTFTLAIPDGQTENVVQTNALDVQFFRPTKGVVKDGATDTVTVVQKGKNNLQIEVPATSGSVNRTKYTGMYLNDDTQLHVIRATHFPAGYVEMQTIEDHGLAVGQKVSLNGFSPSPFLPWRTEYVATTYPATAVTQADLVSIYSKMQSPGVAGTIGGAALALDLDRIAVVGGYSYATGTYAESDKIKLLIIDTSSQHQNNDEAKGSTELTYHWANPAPTGLSVARHNFGASVLPSKGFGISGGFVNPTTFSDLLEVFNSAGTSLSAVNNSNFKRAGHAQYTLTTGTHAGQIMLIGGATDQGNATKTTYFVSAAGAAVGAGASMVNQRCDFGSVMLPNGKIMVAGGRLLGIASTVNANTVAQWSFDDASGDATDSTGTYTLTGSGSPTVVTGKIDRARTLGGAAKYTGGPSAASVLLTSDWTVDFWIKSWTAGIVLSHGGVNDTAANNKILEIELLANNITARWEKGAGTDVSISATSGSVTAAKLGANYWNHVSVVKQTIGSLIQVNFYINGIAVGSGTAPTSDAPTSGSTGVFTIGADPEGVLTKFTGTIDELRVSKEALTITQVQDAYVRGGGHFGSESKDTEIVGKISRETEIYDPASNTWSAGPPMTYSRAYCGLIALTDGRVIAIGGHGYDPTNLTFHAATATSGGGYGQNLTTCEVYDPQLGRWFGLGSLATARRRPICALLSQGNRNKIFVTGGYTAQNDFKSILSTNTTDDYRSEYINLDKFSFELTPDQLNSDTARPGSYGVYLNNQSGQDYVYIEGGLSTSAVTTRPDGLFYVPNTDLMSVGNINSEWTVYSLVDPVTAVSDPKRFYLAKYPGNATSLNQFGNKYGYVSNFGASRSRNITKLDGYRVTNFTRVSNVITATIDTTLEGIPHQIKVGDYVLANSMYSGYTNSGPKLITAVAASTTTGTVSWAETGSNFNSSAVGGSISKQYSQPTVTKFTAGDGVVRGPYVFDPLEGIAITAVGSLLDSEILEQTQVDKIKLTAGTAELFPDEPGYLIFGYGTQDQVGPIKYLGLYSENELAIDYSYIFPKTLVVGTDVTLLSGLAPYDPIFVNGTFEEAWITASPAGRTSAVTFMEAALKAGGKYTIKVKYPSDIGLGGQGDAVKGLKLTDNVEVFGSDDLDTELKKARS